MQPTPKGTWAGAGKPFNWVCRQEGANPGLTPRAVDPLESLRL